MNKYTPGPWEVREVSGAGIQIWASVDLGKQRCEATDTAIGPNLQPLYEVSIRPQLQVGEDGRAYAHICYESWRQFPTLDFETMQRANAKLIAATPKILAALKEMADYYGAAHDDECPKDDTCDCSLKKFNDRVNQAISEAEL